MRKYLLVLLFLIPSCTKVAQQAFDCNDLTQNTGKLLQVRACTGICMPWDSQKPILCSQDVDKDKVKGQVHIQALSPSSSMSDMLTQPMQWLEQHMIVPITPVIP